ncbi:MAG TPA: ABC transporter ATP-binding protein [Candidatus Lumbricidophila sp.]|nr:ABC transporter ATP-binding protein [Candidatus Lumbricidophila sp.]
MTQLIAVHDVSKRFVLHKDKSLKERLVNFRTSRRHVDDFWALRDINLEIGLGTTVGLVGHNGSGKSTLLKVIGGILEPTTGTVARRGQLAALLELGAGFHPDLTGRENVYLNGSILGFSRAEIDRQFDAIVDFSGVESFIDTQVKFYSSGMYVRLAFAIAVHGDPDLLLVDEVLAVGDEPFQRKCMAKISQFQAEGRTIVLVSHSAEQVGSLCDRVVVLNAGQMIHDGSPSRGIQILREGYDAELRASHDDGAGHLDFAYEIVNVAPTTTIDDGRTRLVIDVDVDVNTPKVDWGLGLEVENTLGMALYQMTTFEHMTLPNSIGRHRVRIAVDDVPLGPGKYLFSVGVGSSNGENFDRRSPAGAFDIFGADHGNGVVRLTPQVSLVDAAAAAAD